MKKIPTVFVREYKDNKVVGSKNVFTSEETKYAFEHGVPTVKMDGSCCAIIDGELYKRYDAMEVALSKLNMQLGYLSSSFS